jgi:predicted transcriptional regulator
MQMKPEQLRMARAALGLGVRDLAEMAGVSFTTINRFETGKSGLQLSTAEAIRKALEAQGVQFLESGQVAIGPGVALGMNAKG